MRGVTAAYLCLEFSGGTEFKQELYHIVISVLGGEEQRRRTCLGRTIKKINMSVTLTLTLSTTFDGSDINNTISQNSGVFPVKLLSLTHTETLL